MLSGGSRSLTPLPSPVVASSVHDIIRPPISRLTLLGSLCWLSNLLAKIRVHILEFPSLGTTNRCWKGRKIKRPI